jgi:predicted regulator of Ras-like GTPase activity (Roadblock/LC7/MglB family)
MSVFRQTLDRICGSLDGVISATVMGTDGLPVETVIGDAPARDDDAVEVDALLVEYSSLLDQVQRIAQVFAAGGLEEMAIRSERMVTVMRVVTPEYFVALALTPEASYGKARFLLRVHADRLLAELV